MHASSFSKSCFEITVSRDPQKELDFEKKDVIFCPISLKSWPTAMVKEFVAAVKLSDEFTSMSSAMPGGQPSLTSSSVILTVKKISLHSSPCTRWSTHFTVCAENLLQTAHSSSSDSQSDSQSESLEEMSIKSSMPGQKLSRSSTEIFSGNCSKRNLWKSSALLGACVFFHTMI